MEIPTIIIVAVLCSIISAVVSLLVLMRFFSLCSDVKFIANHYSKQIAFTDRFKSYVVIGKRDLALQVLLEEMESDNDFNQALCNGKFDATIKARNIIEKRYGIYFKTLGFSPDYEAIKAMFGE